ncbi:MAG: group II intron reverse transcriptase/maturase [Rickettsia endosymbiont of Ecitomorpha arachnoides]|nr:group II intron reverse transcriptase/maturase [Rickettsia endosymbiont of Ecitomorpha arachnoides]
MTLKNLSLTGAPLTSANWQSINWQAHEKLVFRLQMRIAKAMREKKYNKVEILQRLLTRSYSAKCLAVRKVTNNKGAKTPGIDGEIWVSDKQKAEAVSTLRHNGYKPLPVRCIYISKSNGKKRPLGIMTIKDRAMQALSLFALEPISEFQADPNSYGFRSYRSCADAIKQCFNVLARKGSAQWILEGDIKSCFNKISHKWLEDNILMDTNLLKKWLKAGYMEKNTLLQTQEGSIQGAILSPCLALMTLSGLEAAVKDGVKPSDKVNVIAYADDFVITGNSKELLENHIKPKVEAFLQQRGLSLSEEKTKITHIQQGFDFLGFYIKKYNAKLLIKPAKKNVKNFLTEIRNTIKNNPTAKTENLIYLLNPKIRGWANYFRHVVSKSTFSKVDYCIFKAIFNWAIRRHPNKNKYWVKGKYFRSTGLRNWIFSAKIGTSEVKNRFVDLFKASTVKIKWHIKIQAAANPFDPVFLDYLVKRVRKGIQAKDLIEIY